MITSYKGKGAFMVIRIKHVLWLMDVFLDFTERTVLTKNSKMTGNSLVISFNQTTKY